MDREARVRLCIANTYNSSRSGIKEIVAPQPVS